MKIPDIKQIFEERRQKECTGKAQYTNMQAAERARNRMEKRFFPQIFRAYSCTFCGRFHIGHSSNQKELQRREKKGNG